MKRIITLVAVAAASLLMAARAHAQFGIVGGITSSTTDMTTAEDVKAMSLYHAGLTYKFNLGGGFVQGEDRIRGIAPGTSVGA